LGDKFDPIGNAKPPFFGAGLANVENGLKNHAKIRVKKAFAILLHLWKTGGATKFIA
jgi:hypothetical protein